MPSVDVLKYEPDTTFQLPKVGARRLQDNALQIVPLESILMKQRDKASKEQQQVSLINEMQIHNEAIDQNMPVSQMNTIEMADPDLD